jgi:hypothetical protein
MVFRSSDGLRSALRDKTRKIEDEISALLSDKQILDDFAIALAEEKAPE